jgi:alpha-amylase
MKCLLILFACLLFILFGCRQSAVETISHSADSSDIDYSLPDWAKDATIYEVNIRQYTPEGTFHAFTEHLPRLKSMGVDILWFMPIYPISEKNKKGTLGSPYAVSDYKAVNPEFGTVEDFDAMVSAIHQLDMHIILDFVPNHTGWDHHWITEHKDWYTQDSEGHVVDPIDPGTGKSWGWTDVADLNYDNSDMREAMIDAFKYWITQRQVDGYRMDVAHNVPQDFWETARDTLFSLDRDIFMLAEAEEPQQRNNEVFHASYGWEVHHILNDIAQGKKDVTHINEWKKRDESKFNKGFHMMFTSNHDENSWNGTEFERMGDAHKMMAIWAATFDGMPLIYSGMEEPLTRRLEFFEKDPINFKDFKYQDFYTQLFGLKHRNKALWNGTYGGQTIVLNDSKDVLIYKREKDKDRIVAILNMTSQDQKVTWPIEINGINSTILTDKTTILDNEILLGPWGYYVASNR